ncbi:hypothetical protein [Terriglobus sp.]|uniref:hypothetical protein n=1 Tax=Terriglobus sp. TaxID=1889013 RepID=UPI003AFFA4E3
MSRVARMLTVSLTVATGLLVQTGKKQNIAEEAPPHIASAQTLSSGTAEVGDGPWVASCRYWAAIDIAEAGKRDTGRPTRCGEVGPEPAQRGDRAEPPNAFGWGIPNHANGHVDVTTMVAVVPDPVHSGLALEFDRTMDAILLAAADNHYLSSRYWLPWQQHRGTGAKDEEGAANSSPAAGEQSRERQPGLIVLRYAPDAAEWPSDEASSNNGQNSDTNQTASNLRKNFAWNAYGRVIYLFLVAETPALGVNGEQLQNALRYESILQESYGAHLSLHGAQPNGPLTSKVAQAAKPPRSSSSPPAIRSTQEQSQSTTISSSNTATSAVPCQTVPARQGDRNPPHPEHDLLAIIGPSFSGTAASLHAGVEAARPQLGCPGVSITGATGTSVALHELDPESAGNYRSFGEDNRFEQERFLEALIASGYDLSRVAVLSEAGTVFGATTRVFHAPAQSETGNGKLKQDSPCVQGRSGCYRLDVDKPLDQAGTLLNLRFPRELSVLRNAAANDTKHTAGTAPTPYLDLSLKGDAADDTVTRFSTTQSPLSIEAQLMAIADQLNRARSQFILISASNALDDLFLAQFLHRACPDARIVLSAGGDLLFERDGENAPYIGSVSLSPYLLSSLSFGERPQWLHADYRSDQMYNAASFAFRDPASHSLPSLSGYLRPPASRLTTQIPLWATAIGADGYYPLAVLSWCGSSQPGLLASISLAPSGNVVNVTQCSEEDAGFSRKRTSASSPAVPESINVNSRIAPALSWDILAILLCLACLVHSVGLSVADLWSPFTRDLAIDRNDLPHRRAVYLNIGASVLAAMAFITAYPILRVSHYFPITRGSRAVAIGLLCCAAIVCLSTARKTWRYFYHRRCRTYTFFHCMAAVSLLGTVLLWVSICDSDSLYGYPNFAGLFFNFRCLRPLSGVSPICPVLLVLLAWYLWAIYQTARLRFSHVHRPRLPRLVAREGPYDPHRNPYPLYVPDEALENCALQRSNCLYADITCLLITREIAARFLKGSNANARSPLFRHLDAIMGLAYAALFCCCLFLFRIHSLDTFVFKPFLFPSAPTLYELLLKALFFPLLMIAFSGWLRVMFIWAALNRGLLEPLERMPVRFAFDRYKSGGWVSMLRQKGLHIRWRDMARSTESIRQIVYHPELQAQPALLARLSLAYQAINLHILALQQNISAPQHDAPQLSAGASAGEGACSSKPAALDPMWDLPKHDADTCGILHIEEGYANFCTALIDGLLADSWERQRCSPVDQNSPSAQDGESAGTSSEQTPSLLHLAEELIVVRYVSLIRAVLLNIRYQMVLVTTTFVLALVAWNSYPFQPHAFLDWAFTFLLAVLSFGFILVFAQMHRSALLSRITDTKPNELGFDFFFRVVTFGAVPVLTWLAYQFPQIGGSLYKLVQPGLQMVK